MQFCSQLICEKLWAVTVLNVRLYSELCTSQLPYENIYGVRGRLRTWAGHALEAKTKKQENAGCKAEQNFGSVKIATERDQYLVFSFFAVQGFRQCDWSIDCLCSCIAKLRMDLTNCFKSIMIISYSCFSANDRIYQLLNCAIHSQCRCKNATLNIAKYAF